MDARAITPILNVSNLTESFRWFEKIGWKKNWDWGDPPGFGAVGSGECEIFLCEDCQGGRGKGENSSTFGPNGDEVSDKGVWLSIWVDDVDAIYRQASNNGVEIVFEPEDMPWGVRECHVRHPDGHVFRISTSITQNTADNRNLCS
jgi:catechol 2,3-dioxygenase-like lactoylglutathione lyase family enzyme